jgi:hypothetical protein
MTIVTHALSEKDATTMRQIRESLQGIKGTATGPQASPMFDEVMKRVAPSTAAPLHIGAVACDFKAAEGHRYGVLAKPGRKQPSVDATTRN